MDRHDWSCYDMPEDFWALDPVVVKTIAKYLPFSMVPTITLVCKAWREAVYDDSILDDEESKKCLANAVSGGDRDTCL